MKYYGQELYHFGILGQKWGERNYQNKDGSYTEKGQEENNGHGRYAPNYEGASDNTITNNKKLTEKNKKILMGAAIGAAVALGVGTVVYISVKKVPIKGDIVLSSDTILQRISPSGEKELHDVFYASFDKKDNLRYLNTLPKHYWDRGYYDTMVKKIQINNDIKIAGHDTCRRIFHQIMEDSDRGKISIEIPFNSYDDANVYAYAARESALKDFYDVFFKRIKDAGYQGFLDINDQKYSNYNAKAPVVLFNNSNIFNVSSISKITSDLDEISSKQQKEIVKIAIEDFFKDPINTTQFAAYATYGGAVVGAMIGSSIKTKTKNKETK